MTPWGISRLTARPAFAVALRYGLAVASVATALGINLILRHYGFPPRFISHFTLIAIAITFWCAGTGPGLLALLLSCLGVGLFARNHFLLPGFPLESFLIFYAVFSVLMSWFSASRRRAQQLLTEARDNLEFRVAARTDELVRANAELEDTQAALRSREAYLAQAQRLSQTGSFGWRPSSGEILWSEETFRPGGWARTRRFSHNRRGRRRCVCCKLCVVFRRHSVGCTVEEADSTTDRAGGNVDGSDCCGHSLRPPLARDPDCIAPNRRPHVLLQCALCVAADVGAKRE